MLLKAVRNGLGQAIILADFVSRPRKLQRSAEAQAEVERALRNLSLYQFRACPFCVKTRRAMHRLNLPMQLKDAMNDPQARQALLEGGGKVNVPAHRGKRPGALDVRIQRDHRLSGRSFRQRLSGRSTAPGRVQGQPVDQETRRHLALAPRQQAVANA